MRRVRHVFLRRSAPGPQDCHAMPRSCSIRSSEHGVAEGCECLSGTRIPPGNPDATTRSTPPAAPQNDQLAPLLRSLPWALLRRHVQHLTSPCPQLPLSGTNSQRQLSLEPSLDDAIDPARRALRGPHSLYRLSTRCK